MVGGGPRRACILPRPGARAVVAGAALPTEPAAGEGCGPSAVSRGVWQARGYVRGRRRARTAMLRPCRQCNPCTLPIYTLPIGTLPKV